MMSCFDPRVTQLQPRRCSQSSQPAVCEIRNNDPHESARRQEGTFRSTGRAIGISIRAACLQYSVALQCDGCRHLLGSHPKSICTDFPTSSQRLSALPVQASASASLVSSCLVPGNPASILPVPSLPFQRKHPIPSSGQREGLLTTITNTKAHLIKNNLACFYSLINNTRSHLVGHSSHAQTVSLDKAAPSADTSLG